MHREIGTTRTFDPPFRKPEMTVKNHVAKVIVITSVPGGDKASLLADIGERYQQTSGAGDAEEGADICLKESK